MVSIDTENAADLDALESERVQIGGLSVARELAAFLDEEALPAAGIAPASFWPGLERIAAETKGRNRALLAERDRLQSAIDDWHRVSGGAGDPARYRRLLEEIGYLVPEPAEVGISTTGVDDEIARISGPQLVVPVTNARYALNAVNARWGSLYDALYGTDAIAGPAPAGPYDPARGAEVIAYGKAVLDDIAPLTLGSHAEAVSYRVTDGALAVELGDGRHAALADPAGFAGWTGDPSAPASVVLVHHGLHAIVRIARDRPVGSTDPAGVDDIVLESAITTIVDFEDSVATVDAADKVAAYRNWLLLNEGTLTATFEKGGRTTTRSLHDDLEILAPGGSTRRLPGRALMFVRNVGHLMTSDAVLDADGDEIGEGILDAVVTAVGAIPGIDRANPRRNGLEGSIYIVKPKMHGPAEVRFTVDVFAAVEELVGLPPRTIKLGLMDEERRTSVNLKASIAEASERIVFVNTGFLDRSGDEIHTSMEAGAVVPKADMKLQRWISAYEDQNVDIALETGFAGRAQIGKGMWAMPDRMADMLQQKIAHPQAGASTAWVPSPTAATLHALHYHRVDVRARQDALAGARRGTLDDLLRLPLGDPAEWSAEQRRTEVDNNVQSLLGYVVRWIDQGVGCSKVPDIHDVGLMEDRATLRISSQLLANWLRHGVVGEADVRESLERIAAIVDAQNAADPAYLPMAPEPAASIAFQAASDLVFEGTRQPSGYTEPILHRRRREAKRAQRAG